MIEYERRDFDGSWNIHEPDAPATNTGITSAEQIAKCNTLTVMDITESNNDGCPMASGGTCVAESDVSVIAYNAANGLSYKWKIISGNVTFLSDGVGGFIDNTQTIAVRSSSGKDETFTVECTLTDGDGNQAAKQATFTHDRSVVI